MSFFEYYYNRVLKYELLTKYFYKNVNQLPKLEKIVLSFTCNQMSLKNLLPLLSSMIFISLRTPYVNTSKRMNVVLRVKSGLPVGCRVDIRGPQKFLFFEKLIFSVFPRLKDYILTLQRGVLFFSISNLFVFKEIEKDFEHFPDLPKLNVSLVFKAAHRREILDLLRGFHFPLNKLKNFF